MGIRACRQDDQERLDDGVGPGERIGSGGQQRRDGQVERGAEIRRVLARDVIASGRELHRLDQRHGRILVHVLGVGRAEPTGRRQADGRVNLTRILDAGGREHLVHVGPQCSRRRRTGAAVRVPPRAGRACDWRQQQDDPQIRIGARPGGRRLYGRTNRPPERLAGGLPERLADRRRARHEIDDAHVVEGAPGRHVSRLGREHLEQAGELCGGGDVGVGPHPGDRIGAAITHDVEDDAAARRAATATRRSTIAPATSTPVARCTPSHPGMPFTSSTNTVPSGDGSRSTPA